MSFKFFRQEMVGTEETARAQDQPAIRADIRVAVAKSLEATVRQAVLECGRAGSSVDVHKQREEERPCMCQDRWATRFLSHRRRHRTAPHRVGERRRDRIKSTTVQDL